MTLGLEEAARRAGAELEVVLAVDNDEAAAETFAANFPEALVLTEDVTKLFTGAPGDPVTPEELALRKRIGRVDVLCLGSPCQGHSDLNNHTRRKDPKNALYFKAVRAAEVLQPVVVISENVPSARRDVDDVVERTSSGLVELGYVVDGAVVDMTRLGVPQKRRRFVLLASRTDQVIPSIVLAELKRETHPERDVRWAIGDLLDAEETGYDEPSEMSEENRRRVNILFERRIYDLPNKERPPCHREKEHSYKSVYGRLRWNKPAQTITTGFTSMGQGRFVHPGQPRTLTPHEAARLQTFPDWFRWPILKRTKLARMIGNAVPPLLMVRIGNHVIDALVASGRMRLSDEYNVQDPPAVIGRRPKPHARRPSSRHQARAGVAKGVARAKPSVRSGHRSDKGIASTV